MDKKGRFATEGYELEEVKATDLLRLTDVVDIENNDFSHITTVKRRPADNANRISEQIPIAKRFTADCIVKEVNEEDT